MEEAMILFFFWSRTSAGESLHYYGLSLFISILSLNNWFCMGVCVGEWLGTFPYICTSIAHILQSI